MKSSIDSEFFFVFCRSSSGRDPVVNSHTQPCGHFTGYTKNKKQNTKKKQKAEERNKHGFRTAKLRKVKSCTFKHSVCICYG